MAYGFPQITNAPFGINVQACMHTELGVLHSAYYNRDI